MIAWPRGRGGKGGPHLERYPGEVGKPPPKEPIMQIDLKEARLCLTCKILHTSWSCPRCGWGPSYFIGEWVKPIAKEIVRVRKEMKEMKKNDSPKLIKIDMGRWVRLTEFPDGTLSLEGILEHPSEEGSYVVRSLRFSSEALFIMLPHIQQWLDEKDAKEKKGGIPGEL